MSVAVVRKIEEILHSSFDIKNYVDLVREIFPDVRMIAPEKLNKELTNFSSHIEGSVHVGTFQTPDNKKIIIMAVELKKAGYVENSSSTHRSYAKKLIENGNADAAFIAFYTDGDPRWRLSFVRLDYEMKIENGRLKTAETLTPAKRYSYLVGRGEPCHTAISQFERFITDSSVNPERPTLDDLENAFSVEKVTDEFFNLYCEKFHQLREQLEAIEDFCIEAEHRNFTAAQFSKKLMGQIVFLYFLQKKGWLGVRAWPNVITEEEYQRAYYARGAKSRELIPIVYRPKGDGTYHISNAGLGSISDADEEVLAMCVKGEPWGSGPHDFMRMLFNTAVRRNQNFYNDLLEPLFYDALNRNRGEQGYCAALHCRIPFLSGGLFEPIDGYDWEHNDFSIPNDVFSNVATKGRDADGILDIFDRYNFTMSEDEPMEREVAIDPEMLGKVFENLLEINDRKSKGAYYTPREIVHYMCQESLIKYLTTTLALPEDDIRDFIVYGDFMKDEDANNEKRVNNNGLWIPKSLFEMDNGNISVNNLTEMDAALSRVKVLDPAVGSGAFPLCMVNEIVRIRQNISAYLSIGMNDEEKNAFYSNGRTAYWLKYSTIRNCIFAVDNEPSAVDIAQLRLWLSLVIDAEINPTANSPLDGMSSPMPLPNLEGNILCSDSLVYSFNGISLFGKPGVITSSLKEIQNRMHLPEFLPLLNGLFAEQDKLYFCDDPIRKGQIKDNIRAYKMEIVRRSIIGDSNQNIHEYKRAINLSSCPFTLWQLDFAKVFLDNGGFDIVVGNPPYVQLQKTLSENTDEKVGDRYSKLGYKSFAKSGDMYCLFYELGVHLLKDRGHLIYITSNKWMRTAYGNQLRCLFSQKTNPKRLIDFSGRRVFETAGVDVSIFLLENAKNEAKTKVCTIKESIKGNLDSYIQKHSLEMPFLNGESWNILPNIEEEIKKKILSVGIPISSWKISIKYGIKTCLNKVYVIDEATKTRLCDEDPASEEVLSPVLRGRDIGKWTCNYQNLWLVAIHNGIHKHKVPPVDIDKYPAVKRYLTPHMDELKKKIDQGVTPYHLKNCTYYEEYSLPKIVFQEIEQSPSFALDSEGRYMCVDTVRIITGERIEYLTGLLNSNLFFFAVKHFFGGGTLGESGVRMKHTFFKAFTAYVPTGEEEQYIKNIVVSNEADKDEKINEFFYKKYRLTPEEISYIESDMKQVKK